MNQRLFRKVSLERVSSPEQLNQYIRVSSPSVWLLLSAIIVLLAAACIWGVTGRLETTLSLKALVKDNEAVCFLTEEQYAQVEDGMVMRLGAASGVVAELPAKPSSYESLCERMEEYQLYAAGVTEDSWHYPVTILIDLPDGIYDAQIVTDSVSPLSFLIN